MLLLFILLCFGFSFLFFFCFGLLKNVFIWVESFLSFVFIESFILKASKCLLPFLRTRWQVFPGGSIKRGYKESGGKIR